MWYVDPHLPLPIEVDDPITEDGNWYVTENLDFSKVIVLIPKSKQLKRSERYKVSCAFIEKPGLF